MSKCVLRTVIIIRNGKRNLYQLNHRHADDIKKNRHTHRVYNWTNKGNIHLLYITSNAWHGTCKMIASNRFQDAAGNPRNAQESRRDSEGTQFHERYWERRKRDQSTQKVVVTELLNNNNRSSEMAHNTRMCHCETSKQ